jgi:hypothetical protein
VDVLGSSGLTFKIIAMRNLVVLVFTYLFAFNAVSAQILSEREESRVVDEILHDRFNVLLPQLMERTGIDMWVVISREYNEDPVLKTMLPSTLAVCKKNNHVGFLQRP